MAPSIFSTSNREVGSVSLFEIRLDQSNLILQGGEDDASSVLLKGTLVLCLSDSLSFRNVRMRFTGEKRIGWYQPGGTGNNCVKHHDEFLRHNWDFLIPTKRSGDTLQKGNYEWPFEYVLSGHALESVEGLTDSWVIYRMKATVERGILQQNPVARQHVRIIRTLDASALELSHAMSVENTWPEKISYSLSTPTKGVIFGTAIRVDFRIIPLLKALEIGHVTTELVETQEMTVHNPKHPRQSKTARVIVKDKWKLPNDIETEEVDGQDAYVFQRQLNIPKNLRHCVQSIEIPGIKIRHTLNFNVQLLNPDGHISELHATLPLFIYISPNLPLDENNDMIHQQGSMPIDLETVRNLAPPVYGEHRFDQLYSEVDLSGFMTPAGGVSGIGTPFTSHSRTTSAENLTSMDALTLQSRLHNLEPGGLSRWARDRPYHPSGSADDAFESNQDLHRDGESSPAAQNPTLLNGCFDNSESPDQTSYSTFVSRRPSEDDAVPSGTHTPQHIELSFEDLAKVPSYSTARHSRAIAPINDGLPNYQAAIQTPIAQPPLPRVPSQAHVVNHVEDDTSQAMHVN